MRRGLSPPGCRAAADFSDASRHPRLNSARPPPGRRQESDIEPIIAALAGFIASVISAGGYLGVVAMMAVESAGLPLPSELIMPFAGYLASTGRFDLVLVATAGAIGCNVGSAVAYAIGYYGGRPFILKYGRYVLAGPHELQRVEAFFARHGSLAVFIGRLLPVIRTFIALPAGMARMRQIPFHLYTFLGSWPWCYGLARIGYELGARWDTTPWLREAFHYVDAVVVGAVVLAAGWFAFRKFSARAG